MLRTDLVLLAAFCIKAGPSVFMANEPPPNPLHLKHIKLDQGVNECGVKPKPIYRNQANVELVARWFQWTANLMWPAHTALLF